MQVFFSAPPAV